MSTNKKNGAAAPKKQDEVTLSRSAAPKKQGYTDATSGTLKSAEPSQTVKVAKVDSVTVSKTDSEESVGKSRWYHACSLLLGDVMGTGILSLPAASVILGWVPSMIVLWLFGAASIYAGWLLSEVKGMYPTCNSYTDCARELVGDKFAIFTRVMIVVSWGMTLPYYLLGIAEALSLCAPNSSMCYYEWTLIATAILILPTQLRDLHSVSFIAAPSAVAMLVAVLLIIIGIISDSDQSFGKDTTVGFVEGTPFMQIYSSLSAFVFAFQGHSKFLEIAAAMKNPVAEFPLALWVAYPVMTFAYCITVFVAYGFQGSAVEDFLPAGLSDGALKTIVGVLLAFHIAVAYVFTQTNFIQVLQMWIFGTEAVMDPGRRGISTWALVSLGFLAFAYVLANAIPFFSDLQELVGSISGAPIIFGWPPLFWLLAMRAQKRHISLTHKIMCGLLFLGICFPMFTVLGTYASIEDIVNDVSESGTPFGCTDDSLLLLPPALPGAPSAPPVSADYLADLPVSEQIRLKAYGHKNFMRPAF